MIQKAGKIKRGGSLKKIFSSVIIFLLILFFAGFLFLSSWRIKQRRAELFYQIEALKKEIETLEKKNRELEAGVSRFSEESYLEEMAREKLGLKKPGEEVVVVLPLPESQEEKPEEKSFWQKIWSPIRNFFK